MALSTPPLSGPVLAPLVFFCLWLGLFLPVVLFNSELQPLLWLPRDFWPLLLRLLNRSLLGTYGWLPRPLSELQSGFAVRVPNGLAFHGYEVFLPLRTPCICLIPLVLGDLHAKEILQRWEEAFVAYITAAQLTKLLLRFGYAFHNEEEHILLGTTKIPYPFKDLCDPLDSDPRSWELAAPTTLPCGSTHNQARRVGVSPTSSLRFHAFVCWAKIENYVSVDFVSKWREADDKFKISKFII